MSPRPRPARLLLVVGAVVLAMIAAGLGARWFIETTRSPACEFVSGGQSHEVTPEQAANAATVSLVAVGRQLPRRAVTVGLATVIQESGLRNLNYGDADSLGLFQQRPSQGWGSPDEVRDPVYASHTFYDALLEVSGWEQMEVTVAAQTVQRSAFPTAYADHEAEARIMAAVLTGQVDTGITCRLPAARGEGSAQATLAKAERQFAASGAVDGTRVRLQAGDTERAWAIASWAVAHAQAEDVTAVEVDGRRWDRVENAWLSATDPASGEVVIHLG